MQKRTPTIGFTRLGEVKVTDPYIAGAMRRETDYLLSLDADKLLYFFFVNAGLPPKADFSYGVREKQGLSQWEGGLIGGHFTGHYLSALAQAYANSNTPAGDRREILGRIRCLTAQLKACQDNAVAAGSKAGFLWGASLTQTGGTENFEYQFDCVERTGNGFSPDAWVPWYTMHKLIAGLLDCATLAGDGAAKEVVLALGDWTCGRVLKWDAETQSRVLKAEYGGMNDCLYRLYAWTGEERYAVAAHRFDEEPLFDKILAAKTDYLYRLHANTTIPKIIGALNRYAVLDGKTVGGKKVDAGRYLRVAEEFWKHLTEKHTYLTGGNSDREFFGRDGALNAMRSNTNCETCNTYNTLKLSRSLFALTGKKKYLDYYENTYYNAILASQNPETGMTTYFQPMATGFFKTYSSRENSFWCCTGTGAESFTKLGDGIYYAAGNATYVSLYLASEYRTDGVSLTMNADLENSDDVEITVGGGATLLRLRRPYWSESFRVFLNGEAVAAGEADAFVSVAVEKGDAVRIELKKRVRAYALPDAPDVYGFLYGPFLLAARLGKKSMTTREFGVGVPVPARGIGDGTVSVAAESVRDFMDGIDAHMKRIGGNEFKLAREGGGLVFTYYFRLHGERYGVYFPFAAENRKKIPKKQKNSQKS